MFDIREIKLEDITIKDRSRKDIGDLKDLVTSIQRDGLLYPILLDEKLQLVDGERRILAHKELSLPVIMARVIPGLTPSDVKLIEFISNETRKSFVWHEELLIKLEIHNKWCASEKDWSYRKTAERLGTSLGGLSTDLTLAGALLAFPYLKEQQSKGKAREAYKKLQDQASSIQAISALDDKEASILKGMLNGERDHTDVIPSERDLKEEPPMAKPPIHYVDDDDDSQEYPSECMEVEERPATAEPKLPGFIYEICSYMELLSKLPTGTIGMAEIDPPYAIDFNNVYGQSENIIPTAEDWTVDKLYNAMPELLGLLYEKMLDNSWVLCWTGKEHWLEMNKIAKASGFGVQPPGIWVKPSGSSNTPTTTMISTYEMFLLFRKGQAKFNIPSMPATISYPPPPSAVRYHQWQKPMEMYKYLVSAMGKVGSIFFSPFAGSGQAMIASALYGMVPAGCDIDRKYFYRFYQELKSYYC